MNKKTLLTKTLGFIYKANIKYKESEIGDIILFIIIFWMCMLTDVAPLIFLLLIGGLRAIYEFDILERLGVINEEENNKKNDD